MSIAFSALILAILALPGIIFRKASSLAEAPLARKRPYSEELVEGLGVASSLHVVWLTIAVWISPLTKVRPDVESTLFFVMGEYDGGDAVRRTAISAVVEHPWGILIYFLTICFAAYQVGRAFRRYRNWKLKRTKSMAACVDALKDEPSSMRWAAWCGALETELYNKISDEEKALPPTIAMVVEIGGIAYLYKGLLARIGWGDDGNPHRFELEYARRRPFNSDRSEDGTDPDSRFYRISGKRLIVFAEHAKTINVDMWWANASVTASLTNVVENTQVEPSTGTESEN